VRCLAVKPHLARHLWGTGAAGWLPPD